MLWSGGLFTSATRGTMPVGAYILTGSPMSDKSKGRHKTKTDLLAPGFVRSLLVRKQQRKEPKHLDAISFQRKLAHAEQTGVEDLHCCPLCQPVLQAVSK